MHDNTGGKAPPAVMSIEQRTMFALALVLMVAVPTALIAYMWHKRRNAHRKGYAPLAGDTASPSITTTV